MARANVHAIGSMRNEVGTLAPGKRADLVVLDSDPLSEIHNLQTGRWVVTGGRLLDEATLQRAVHFTKR